MHVQCCAAKFCATKLGTAKIMRWRRWGRLGNFTEVRRLQRLFLPRKDRNLAIAPRPDHLVRLVTPRVRDIGAVLRCTKRKNRRTRRRTINYSRRATWHAATGDLRVGRDRVFSSFRAFPWPYRHSIDTDPQSEALFFLVDRPTSSLWDNNGLGMGSRLRCISLKIHIVNGKFLLRKTLDHFTRARNVILHMINVIFNVDHV